MNISFEELIEEVKEEIACYEELGEKAGEQWEKEFQQWLDKNKGKHKDIKKEKGTLCFHIKDESEIFEIADSYYDAVMENSVKNYWNEF